MSQSDSLSKITAEHKAVFSLIDVVFSLECCLNYQILPLELSDNHLVLGMVNPKDKKTIQHLTPIISSFDYSFHIQAIDAHTHQLVLATYLKSSPQDFSSHNSVQSSEIIVTSSSINQISQNVASNKPLNNSPTLFDLPEEAVSNKPLNNSPTLFDLPEEAVSNKPLNNSPTLFDLPEEAVSNKPLNNSPTLFDLPEEAVSNKPLNNSPTLFDLPEEPTINQPLHNSPNLVDLSETSESIAYATNLHERPTFIVNSNREELSDQEDEQSQIFFSEPQINNIEENNSSIYHSKKLEQNITFDVANYIIRPLESLKDLPPELLWQELLARILSKGIGRLYLQQHHSYGRILCSQDGVVQSSLNKVPLSKFQGVIKEIKMMAKLPLKKIEKTKKVALQRYYNHERLLLRIEFLVGKFGEEITIQVLRGQALKFYEQRQAGKTLDQAIYLGQKLEKNLRKIRMCKNSADVSDLSALKAIMRQVEKQLRLLDC